MPALSNAARQYKYSLKKKGLPDEVIWRKMVERGHVKVRPMPDDPDPPCEIVTKKQKKALPVSTAPPVDECCIDESFKKLIQYSHYAKQHDVEMTTATVLSHLDKTDQLIAQQAEVMNYTDLLEQLETFWTGLITPYEPKPPIVE